MRGGQPGGDQGRGGRATGCSRGAAAAAWPDPAGHPAARACQLPCGHHWPRGQRQEQPAGRSPGRNAPLGGCPAGAVGRAGEPPPRPGCGSGRRRGGRCAGLPGGVCGTGRMDPGWHRQVRPQELPAGCSPACFENDAPGFRLPTHRRRARCGSPRRGTLPGDCRLHATSLSWPARQPTCCRGARRPLHAHWLASRPPPPPLPPHSPPPPGCREVVLFGAPLDPVRYRAVLHACALLPDLRAWPAGDRTLGAVPGPACRLACHAWVDSCRLGRGACRLGGQLQAGPGCRLGGQLQVPAGRGLPKRAEGDLASAPRPPACCPPASSQ